MAFISGKQGNKDHLLRGTKTILADREHKKTNFRFLGNRGTGTPLGGPHMYIVFRQAGIFLVQNMNRP